MDFETLFHRFDHIAIAIFKGLDDKTLLDCRRVCHSWNSFLNESQFWRKCWTEKLEKVLATKLLDKFSRARVVHDHYIGTDLSLPTLQILVIGLKGGIGRFYPNDKKRTDIKLSDPFSEACKNGNIGFIKLAINCPIKEYKAKEVWPFWGTRTLKGYNMRDAFTYGQIMSNTKTTKYFLDNLEEFDFDIANFEGRPLFVYAAKIFTRNSSDVSAHCLMLIFDKSVEKNIDVKAKFPYNADYEIANKEYLNWEKFSNGSVYFPEDYETEELYENIYEMILRNPFRQMSYDRFNPPSLTFLELWKDFDIELTPWTFNKLSKLHVQKLVVEIYHKMSVKCPVLGQMYPGGEIDRLLEYPKTCQSGRLYQKNIEHLGKGILLKVIVEYLSIKSGDKECPKQLSRAEKRKLQKSRELAHDAKKKKT